MEIHNGVTFTFHPENEADARSYIASLIPFLKESFNNPWFLKQFSQDALLWHSTSKWDHETRQAYTAEEAELDTFLQEDDELNLTDDAPMDRISKTSGIEIKIHKVADSEDYPPMYHDTDSISTFHPVTPSHSSTTPSVRFSPKSIPLSSKSEDKKSDSVSKMTDSKSRISSLEYKFNLFQDGIKEIKRQAKKESLKMPRPSRKFYLFYKPGSLAGRTRLTINTLLRLIIRPTP